MTTTPHPVSLGDGLTVSPLGFGGMALTAAYDGGTDDATALATLHHAVDAGVTFLDTADVYGSGQNERLIGRLLAERRDEITIATKFGITGNPADPDARAKGTPLTRGDAAYVRSACDASLARLGIETIDLYYLHRRDLTVPIEETVGAMAGLVSEGKVRHLGLSEVTAAELRAAVAVHPIAAVQSEWSVWSRDVEARVVPAAAELGVGFVPYSPLGRGFLAGGIQSTRDLPTGDFRRLVPRFADETLARNLAALGAVRSVAAELAATPAQVALAWLYAAGRRAGLPVVPIPGTRKPERVVENLGALSLGLSEEQVRVLDGVAGAVVGTRSNDPGWVSSGRE